MYCCPCKALKPVHAQVRINDSFPTFFSWGIAMSVVNTKYLSVSFAFDHKKHTAKTSVYRKSD